MPRAIKAKNGGTLIVPNKGETMNPNGRPRKFVGALKARGYKASEINDCISTMLALTVDELKTVFENPKATILEKTVANALKTSLTKGNLDSIETLLTRAFGAPKVTTENKHMGAIVVSELPDGLTLDQLRKLADR